MRTRVANTNHPLATSSAPEYNVTTFTSAHDEAGEITARIKGVVDRVTQSIKENMAAIVVRDNPGMSAEEIDEQSKLFANKIKHARNLVYNEMASVLTPEPTKQDQLLESVASNHPELSKDKQAELYIHAWNEYALEAVPTPHPTNPASTDTDHKLHDIGDIVSHMKSHPYTEEDDTKLAVFTRDLMVKAIGQPEKMTPTEESERDIENWGRRMEAYGALRKSVVAKVQKAIYGGEPIPEPIQQELDKAIQKQFESASWFGHDQDGNPTAMADDIRIIIRRRMQAAHELFLAHTAKLEEKIAQKIALDTFGALPSHDEKEAQKTLNEVQAIWDRAIADKSTTDKGNIHADSPENKQAALDKLKSLANNEKLSDDIRESAGSLHDVVSVVYATGLPNMHTREDAAKYTAHTQDIFAVLHAHKEALTSKKLRTFLEENQSYPMVDPKKSREDNEAVYQKQYEFFTLLRGKKKNNVAQVLFDHRSEIDRENKNGTQRRFGHIAVQIEFGKPKDISILSEAMHVNNIHEMAAMHSFGRFFYERDLEALKAKQAAGELEKNEMKPELRDWQKQPFGTPLGIAMTLHENKESLLASPGIISGLHADPVLKAYVRRVKQINFLDGPSDTARRAGIKIHSTIPKVRNKRWDVLAQFPDFADVNIRILNGSGGDKRRHLVGPNFIDDHEVDHFQTWQGRVTEEATRAEGMAKIVLASAGTMGPIEQLAYEQRQQASGNLGEDIQKKYHTTAAIDSVCTDHYGKFIKRKDINEAYQVILGERGNEAVSRSNRSSRPGARDGIPTIENARAIGGVTIAESVRSRFEVTEALAPMKDEILARKARGEHAEILNIDEDTSQRMTFGKVGFALSSSNLSWAWERLGKADITHQEVKEYAQQYQTKTDAEKAAMTSVERARLTEGYYHSVQPDRLDTLSYMLPEPHAQKMRDAITTFQKNNPDYLMKMDQMARFALHASGHEHAIQTANDAGRIQGNDMAIGWEAEKLYHQRKTDKPKLKERMLDHAATTTRTLNTLNTFRALAKAKGTVLLDAAKRLFQPVAYAAHKFFRKQQPENNHPMLHVSSTASTVLAENELTVHSSVNSRSPSSKRRLSPEQFATPKKKDLLVRTSSTGNLLDNVKKNQTATSGQSKSR